MATRKMLAMSVTTQAEELERLCRHVTSFCAELDLDKSQTTKVILALEELFTNIISYGFDLQEMTEEPAVHEVDIVLTCLDTELLITLEDDGRAFNPLAMPPPDLERHYEEMHIGGLGIHLVRSIMDRVEYNRIDGRNRLEMAMRTRPPASAIS